MSFSTTQLYDKRKARGKPVTCHWCDTDLAEPTADQIDRRATKDHITPNGDVPRGRATVLACYACNQVRGNMDLMAWVEFMQIHPDFRSLFQTPRLKEAKQSFQLAQTVSTTPKIIEGPLT